MSIIITSNNGKTQYNLKEFLCDSAEDIANLPLDSVAIGSKAFYMSGGTRVTYILDENRNWVEYKGV